MGKSGSFQGPPERDPMDDRDSTIKARTPVAPTQPRCNLAMKPLDPVRSCAFGLLAFTALTALTSAQSCPVGIDINPVQDNTVETLIAPDAHGDVVYMIADDGVHGDELWRWDPVGGAQRLSDLSGTFPKHQQAPTVLWVGGQRLVFFLGADLATGYEPYISDGTSAGTMLLRDVHVGPLSSEPSEFVSTGDLVFFAANTATTRLLLKSDGTTAGTGLVKNFASLGPTFPTELSRFGSRILFSAELASYGAEPWVSDGTPAGTFALGDLSPGSDSSKPAGFTRVGELAVFAAEDPLLGRELYVTDGTWWGTKLLYDFMPGKASGKPSDFTYWQGYVYFTASTNVTGKELWRTDGTLEGTRLVVDLQPGPEGSAPRSLVAAGDRLYFGARLAGATDLLWELPAATGSPTPVSPVKFNDGPLVDFSGNESPNKFPTIVPADGGVYFHGGTLAAGQELFFAIGGTASVVCDLGPGAIGSAPLRGQIAGEHLVWRAFGPLIGFELHVLPVDGARAVDLGFGGPRLRLEVGQPSLGTAVPINLRGGAPGLVLVLGIGPPAEPRGLPNTDGSAIWIDPLLVQFVVHAVGTDLSTAYVLPANPALIGVRAHVQGFGVPTAGTGLTASNGVAVELGP